MDAQLRLIPRGKAPTTDSPRPSRGRADSSTTDATGARPRPSRASLTEVEPAEAPVQWRIDESARERGRVGISRAREALSQARRPSPVDRHVTAA